MQCLLNDAITVPEEVTMKLLVLTDTFCFRSKLGSKVCIVNWTMLFDGEDKIIATSTIGIPLQEAVSPDGT